MTKQQGRIIITFPLRRGFLLALLLFAASLLPRALGQPQIGRKRLIDAQARWVWQNPLPQGNTLYGVSFTNPNTGTATGDNGTIIRTTDGGNSWVIQSSGTTNTLYGVSFTDVNHGTAVGAAGTILRTTDGGNTWSNQTSGTTNGLLAVSFTDSNTGTAVGENGIIVRTTDGGNTWVSQQVGRRIISLLFHSPIRITEQLLAGTG